MIDLLQILDEFVEAVMSRWPKTVLQFEDFQLQYAHPLLQRYKDQHLVFNDDIQVMQGSHVHKLSLFAIARKAVLKGSSKCSYHREPQKGVLHRSEIVGTW